MRHYASQVAFVAALAVAGLTLSACATEGYVDEHIAAVNTRVDSVDGKVNALSGRVDALSSRVDTNDRNAQAAIAANRAALDTKSVAKFAYADNGQGTAVNFDTNKWKLTDEAQATLTAFADKLKSENKDVYIEIVGHGDPRGSVMQNRVLGAKRSLEVQRFLAEHGVALSRMAVVSWGEEKVANPKDRSPEALQQSRRVDLIVKG